jgi:sterol desaturase/sphingolipid hydroxylase (fatty acid hydroxylase superfamily)
LDFALDLAWIFAAAYALNLAAYFGFGWVMVQVNRAHPDRRIQPARDGMKRARAEILESVRSIAVTAFCLALALSLQLHGLTLWTPWGGWLGVVGGVVLLAVLYDAWFYWSHRALHTRALYKFHRWHHRSVAPTVWSSDSQTVTETAMIQGFMVVAAVLLPVPPLAIVAHRIWDHVNGQLGHAGYEYFADRTTRFPSPMVCTSFHDQHHELFTWNYANYFSFWDRLMGTLHPDYDRRVEAAETRGTPAE